MSQTLKPLTAAQKLGVHLPATPAEFQSAELTRDEVEQLKADPPPWLVELRRNGPFPRDVVAQKLGISRAALARNGLADSLDGDQIGALLADPPPWLLKERRTYAATIEEHERAKDHRLHR
ncbi:DUF5997 family protein [Microlunatus lacustris]